MAVIGQLNVLAI